MLAEVTVAPGGMIATLYSRIARSSRVACSRRSPSNGGLLNVSPNPSRGSSWIEARTTGENTSAEATGMPTSAAAARHDGRQSARHQISWAAGRPATSRERSLAGCGPRPSTNGHRTCRDVGGSLVACRARRAKLPDTGGGTGADHGRLIVLPRPRDSIWHGSLTRLARVVERLRVEALPGGRVPVRMDDGSQRIFTIAAA